MQESHAENGTAFLPGNGPQWRIAGVFIRLTEKGKNTGEKQQTLSFFAMFFRISLVKSEKIVTDIQEAKGNTTIEESNFYI